MFENVVKMCLQAHFQNFVFLCYIKLAYLGTWMVLFTEIIY